MFDPFGDFHTAGYLRNHSREKDLALVKLAEYQLFRAQLPEALAYLESSVVITYGDFLKVHEILFNGLYPWAGQDRAALLPQRSVSKGAVLFAHPRSSRLAVEEGLAQAQGKAQMAQRPGFVMGMFAYAHPFLDGNGRAMLVVHAELCFRAGISIDWTRTAKNDYLQALTREIESPNDGHLDAYLKPFIGRQIPRRAWMEAIEVLPGLDGAGQQDDTSASYTEPEVIERYKEFERKRNYRLAT